MSVAGARAGLARAWLGAGEPMSRTLGAQTVGAFTLWAHQTEAVARLRASLAEFGGALLADETGLGKTYVALALLAEAQAPVVLAPASLVPMWRAALDEGAVSAPVHSIESLSTGRVSVAANPDLVVVDEAHHFRNPRTQRYAALARMTAHGARILLLSATPVHNRREDLIAILALFLGSRASVIDDGTLGRLVVRRLHDITTRPRVEPLRWLALPDDADTLRDILELPPPVPPRDGLECDALVAHGLVRQWASSAGALTAALRRRLERAAALEAALECDRHPSYRELRGWTRGEGSVQLAFPELLVPETCAAAPEMLDAVRAHARAVRALVLRLQSRDNPDLARADQLRQVLRNHAGRKVVAFSAYEDTVRVLGRHLARDARVCALGGRGGMVAGGRLTRRAAIARFAPVASNERRPSEAQAIDLLLTTDILSEGVNLQDASVVVHLDLPWTPARMEQRVGRVARLGATHSCVSVYAMAPPASTEIVLGVERLLRVKLRRAAAAVGITGTILPMMLSDHRTTDVRATLERWVSEDDGDCPWGAVRAACTGFLAAVSLPSDRALVADLGRGPTSDAAVIARAIRLGEGQLIRFESETRSRAETAAYEWGLQRAAADSAGASDVVATRAARRIAQAVQQAPAHRRPIIATLAAQARRVTVMRLGRGAEAILAELVGADMSDEAWLRAMAAFADAHEQAPTSAEPTSVRVDALLLFQREGPC